MHLTLYYMYNLSLFFFLIKESLFLGGQRFQISHCKYMESSHKCDEVILSKVVIISNYGRFFQIPQAYFQK